MPTQFSKVRSAETLTTQVVSSLRSAITSGQMRPGEKHSVGSIAEQLGVSRTPVREAVLQLAKLGLVEIHKNRGFQVIEQDTADIRRIFEIRRWLEVPAAGIAAATGTAADLQRIQQMYDKMLTAAQNGQLSAMERYDALFHSAILQVLDNPRLTEIVDDLRDLLISRRHTTTGRVGSMTEIVKDHEPILTAILAGDAAAAELAMAGHLDLTRDGVMRIVGDSE